MRWGVEVFYRSFKQTLGQQKMRCRAPQQAMDELHWAMRGFLLLGLMSVDALSKKRIAPKRLGVATALRLVRRNMRRNTAWHYGRDIRVRLGDAVQDSYRRPSSKHARDWPHKKNDSPASPPRIRRGTPEESFLAKITYSVA